MTEKTSNESRLGRFSYLLTGGKKSRRNYVFMIALVLVAFLSFAGVVSADNYWKGASLQTELSGTVNGGVDVKYADTWTTPDKIGDEKSWANFTLSVDPSSETIKFARLYVLVYMGNMTNNYYGTETVNMYRNGANPITLADGQILELDYDRTQGPSYVDVYEYSPADYIQNISRVTSDYLTIFDVKDLATTRNLNVSILTTNVSGNFDGRIKEAKLVYGWDTTTNPKDTKYWINEGHDPVTKNLVNPYVTNTTNFNSVGTPSTYTAKLWVDYSATALGNGTYTWNGMDISKGKTYQPALNNGYYGGINYWTWTNAAGPGISGTGNNVLTYSKTNDWYKIPLAVFTIQ